MPARVDVELGVKNAKFRTGMAQANQAVTGLEKKWQGLMRFGAIGFTGFAAFRSLDVLADKYDRIGKLATRLGQSPEDIQRIGFVAEQTGSDLEIIARALTDADRRLGDLANNTRAAESAAALNLNVEEFLKLPVIEKLAALSDAYEDSGDKAKASADLYNILGRSAAELTPLFAAGGEAVKEMAADVSVASDEMISKAQELNDEWNKFKTDFQNNFAGGLLLAAKGVNPTLGTTVLESDPRFREFLSETKTANLVARSKGRNRGQDILGGLAAFGEGFREPEGRGGVAGVGLAGAFAALQPEITKMLQATEAAEIEAARNVREERLDAEREIRQARLDSAMEEQDALLDRVNRIQGSVNLGRLTRIGGGYAGVNLDAEANLTKDLANQIKEQNRTVNRLADSVAVIDRLTGALDPLTVSVPTARLRGGI